MEKIKFFVFTDDVRGHRVIRFRQECEKLNIDIEIVNVYKTIVCNDNIINENGDIISFGKNNIAWALSNLTTNYFIAKILKQKNIKIWPDAEAECFADKFITNSFFSGIKIPTPKTVLINSYNLNKIASAVGGFPCIIKKSVSTVGKFVEIANNNNEVVEFIKNTFDKAKENTLPMNRIRFLLQEFISEASGIDYRVLCLDGEIMGIIKRSAQSGFKSNISLGGTAEQVEIDEKLKKYSEKILKEGNIFYAGIDFIKKGDDYLAIEVNTSAQFEGFEKATGINVAEKIIKKLIEKRLNN